MKNLQRQLTVTLLLTLLLAWIFVFAFQQFETRRAQTGLQDQGLYDGANQLLTAMPVSLLGNVAPAERFALPPTVQFNGDRASFQVWSLPERWPLLQSRESPAQPLNPSFHDGYTDSDAGGVNWRVYSVTDASGKVQVQLAYSQSELRAKMLANATRGLVIVSILFLLLAAVTCVVIGRAFRKVDRAGAAIERRGPFDLAALPLAGMPGELRPFIR